jgi:hypothetical protein
MAEFSKRLSLVDENLSKAVVAVEADRGAPEKLKKALAEAWAKSRKAVGSLFSANQEEAVAFACEIQKAGDMVREILEAQKGVKDRTREAVISAHLLMQSLRQMN